MDREISQELEWVRVALTRAMLRAENMVHKYKPTDGKELLKDLKVVRESFNHLTREK